MKDNIIFKLLRKEDICGKNRNIYIKINKNNPRITKTKFIKYKGEFVKLTYFIKENYGSFFSCIRARTHCWC